MWRLVLLCVVIFAITIGKVRADEGMWLPILLKNQKFAEMRKKGLKLSAEEIYSVNQACLKDAVIGLVTEGPDNLASFCTASFVSDQGLLITNFHCIMSYIERFSTPQNDFLKYGYWASRREEESFCRGLMVKQLVRMEDVTDRMTEGTQGLSGEEYVRKVNENGKKLAEEVKKEKNLEMRVQSLFANNQYVMSVYRLFKDVRMVAAPPMAISKFGGLSDNWEWPRHTGDFAFLRVYVNENNESRAYNQKNVPYKPTNYLKISLKGVKEDDFAMVLGYPASTRQYVPSFGLQAIIEGQNAAKVKIRGEKLAILKQEMEEHPELRLRYSTRLSSISNSYLKWKGEIQGVRRMGLIEKKEAEEQAFQQWVEASPERKSEYGSVLNDMREVYKELSEYNLANDYFSEAGLNGAEIVPFIGKFEKLVAMYNGRKPVKEASQKNESKRLIGLTKQFFGNWSYEIDRKTFRNMLVRYYEGMPAKFHAEVMIKYLQQYDGDVEKLSQDIFAKSMFTKERDLLTFLESGKENGVKVITEDPLYQLAISYYRIYVERIARQRGAWQTKMVPLYKSFQKGMLEMNQDKMLYPDANGSLRVAYGKVCGGEPEDGLSYRYYTTLDGMYDKYLNHPEDEEYYMPKKMQKLYQSREFGRYADHEGKLRMCFMADIHTTSGNSGSPVVNARGELVGINFDRIWQGVASDYQYDPDICRGIAVDIRYILFVLEKYAPFSYVFDEISIK